MSRANNVCRPSVHDAVCLRERGLPARRLCLGRAEGAAAGSAALLCRLRRPPAAAQRLGVREQRRPADPAEDGQVALQLLAARRLRLGPLRALAGHDRRRRARGAGLCRAHRPRRHTTKDCTHFAHH